MSRGRPRIAFQGVRGAYSEQALYRHFGKDVEAMGLELSEHVCEAVRDGEVDYGILPVENSIVGNVDVNVDLLLHHKVFAIAETYLRIHHCLLAVPGTKLEEIKEVHSHPVALAQCRDFLNRHKIKAVPDFDTAGACKLLMETKERSKATISSSLCSEYYGLEILEDQIQKVKKNITRFLIFIAGNEPPKNHKMHKTSLAFSTKHHPGALLNSLQTFAAEGINLTKLESRPIPENPFEYTFYVDLMGALDDKKVQSCLQKLERDARRIKIIGSYPEASLDLD